MKCKEQMSHAEGLNKPITFVSPSEYPNKYEFNLNLNQSHLKDLITHNNPTKFDHNAQYRSKHDLK
jgi:hypothetical protein